MVQQPIPASLSVRPDGLVMTTVRGAVLSQASMVSMDQAKAVLAQYSAVYGPLLVEATFHNGQVLHALLTPSGMQPYNPASPPPAAPQAPAYAAPAPAPVYTAPAPSPYAVPPAAAPASYAAPYAAPQPQPENSIADLAATVAALPPVRRRSSDPTDPVYRAPGMEKITEALKGTDPGAPDLFAGMDVGGAGVRDASTLEPGTPGEWVSSDDLPGVNIEEDVREAARKQAQKQQAAARTIPRIPSKALKSAAIVGTIFSIVAGLMIAKPWVEDEPAERPDRTVFEQLETGELQGG